jgi:hypothetical protein
MGFLTKYYRPEVFETVERLKNEVKTLDRSNMREVMIFLDKELKKGIKKEVKKLYKLFDFISLERTDLKKFDKNYRNILDSEDSLYDIKKTIFDTIYHFNNNCTPDNLYNWYKLYELLELEYPEFEMNYQEYFDKYYLIKPSIFKQFILINYKKHCK